MKKFFRNNSLSIVFFIFFLITIWLQAFNGWKQYNDDMQDKGGQQVNFGNYFSTGHFLSQHLKTGKVNSCKWLCSLH